MAIETDEVEADQRNPLRMVAVVCALSLTIDAYSFYAHEWNGISIFRTVLNAAFLMLYASKSPLAWVAAALSCTVIIPTYLITRYFGSTAQSPSLPLTASEVSGSVNIS
jgi:hypothetical protein